MNSGPPIVSGWSWLYKIRLPSLSEIGRPVGGLGISTLCAEVSTPVISVFVPGLSAELISCGCIMIQGLDPIVVR